VGGGSFPGATLPTTLVALDAGALGPDGLALRLRVGEPSIIARVHGGRLLLDPRTLDEETFPIVGHALAQALTEWAGGGGRCSWIAMGRSSRTCRTCGIQRGSGC